MKNNTISLPVGLFCKCNKGKIFEQFTKIRGSWESPSGMVHNSNAIQSIFFCDSCGQVFLATKDNGYGKESDDRLKHAEKVLSEGTLCATCIIPVINQVYKIDNQGHGKITYEKIIDPRINEFIDCEVFAFFGKPNNPPVKDPHEVRPFHVPNQGIVMWANSYYEDLKEMISDSLPEGSLEMTKVFHPLFMEYFYVPSECLEVKR